MPKDHQKSCILFYSMLTNHHVYYWLVQLGPLKLWLLIFSAVLSVIILYMLGPFHLQKVQQALSKVYTSQNHPAKRTSADMELRNYPKPKHLSS